MSTVRTVEVDENTHSIAIGYVCWILGVFGFHRFYFGKPVSGTIWFFTGGLCLVGWIVDLFLMPALDRSAERRYVAGPYDYNMTWILFTFLGIFGIHRIYLGKIITGVIYMFTGGLFFVGILYDLWTLNGQISELNVTARSRSVITNR